MDLTWTVVIYLLLAAAIATFIRFYDSPVTPISTAKAIAVAEVFVGALIAAFIALMMVSDGNASVDITQWGVFGGIVAAAAGGMAAVKAIIGGVSTTSTTVTPPTQPKA
jgi:hypothetical protein